MQRRHLRPRDFMCECYMRSFTSTMTVDMMIERLNAQKIMIGSAKSAMTGCVTHLTNVILVTRPAEVSVTRPADVAATRPADVAND